MKIKGSKPRAEGRREVTVELDKDEHLVVVRSSAYYRMGDQLDDVVTGSSIEEAVEVFWNIHEQKWSEA